MSYKSTIFSPPHLRTSRPSVTEQVTRKIGSLAPPPFMTPAVSKTPLKARGVATPQPKTRLDPATGHYDAFSVGVTMTLSESVAMVSAALQMADHCLVSSARWENQGDENRANREYSRAAMYEAVAERIAKAARNSG